MRVSLIIPVLNEARRIDALLTELQPLDLPEVIVVDGGSSDATVDLVRRHPQVRLIQAGRGRAAQMNAGAAAATGDVLWFLHADTRLPAGALRELELALADTAVVAGAFRIWTVPDGEPTWLAPFLHLADARSRYSSLPYGDQALFVRTAAFQAVGGFPDQPLMEDLELSRRLRRVGRIRTVPASVLVSGRRFLARPLYYTFLVNVFPLLYRCGVSPQTLVRWYRDVR